MSPLLFQILLSLRDEPRDAEEIVLRMHELGETKEPPVASFYRGLKRALDAGYLEIVKAGRSPKGVGRPAQRYRITRSGKASLAVEARRLGRLAELALADSSAAGRESR